MKINIPKGTKDIMPDDSGEWQGIEAAIRDICTKFGFREIRTPIFEYTELFDRGIGDNTDVVQKEMYTFNDKGGRSLTLRPEGTAGVARAFIEHGIQKLPFKCYYLSAPIFRYEAPQSGRLRQHHQFGVEVFGAPEASCDAEVICLAMQLFEQLDIKGLTLNINSIGCGECKPEYNKALTRYFSAHESELCDDCKKRLAKNPLRLLDCKQEKCKMLAKTAPIMLDFLCEDCRAHFENLKSYLSAAKVEFNINPFIVRGLDYYTKTVFEITSSSAGAQGTVCGGGRYDGLTRQLGGNPTSGMGFGLGMERLLMAAAGIELKPQKPKILFIATATNSARIPAFELLMSLRRKNIFAVTDTCGKSLKAQFKYADRIEARFVLVIGDDEIAKNTAKIRNMNSGDEYEIELCVLDIENKITEIYTKEMVEKDSPEREDSLSQLR